MATPGRARHSPHQQQQQQQWTLGQLQQQHKEELLQQQHEHLRQLQALQAQLFHDLSSQLGGQDHSSLSQLSSLLDQELTPHGPPVPLSDLDGTLFPQSGRMESPSATPTGLQQPRSHLSSPAIPTEMHTSDALPQTSQSPAFSRAPLLQHPSVQNSVSHSSDVTPITPLRIPSPDPESINNHSPTPPPPHPPTSPHYSPNTSTLTISPAESMEFLRLPPSSSTPPLLTSTAASSTTELAPHTHPSEEEAYDLPDSRHQRTYKSPKPLEFHTTNFSHPTYTTASVTSEPPSSKLYAPVQNPLPRSLGMQSTPQNHHNATSSLQPPAVMSTPHSPLYTTSPLKPPAVIPTLRSPMCVADVRESRTLLLEKHARHVQDVKRYYELELAQLRTQVHELQSQQPSELPKFSSPLKAAGIVSQSPFQGEGGEAQRLQSENAGLRMECSQLQRQVEESEREREVLEDWVKRLQQQVVEWEEHHQSSSRLASVLQERLEDVRGQLRQSEGEARQLQGELQLAVEEAAFWREQRSQDLAKLDQLFDEFELLQKENKSLQESVSSLEGEVEECGREVTTLRATLGRHKTQEAQCKSTISHLEEEVRHLQHINNRLHSQATHYGLGSNWPDEDKLQHSPRSATPPRNKPRPTTHPSPKHPASPHTPPPPRVSLTRRKWLQPSDPGLIFGAPSPHSTTTTPVPKPSPRHEHPRGSPRREEMRVEEVESSPLLVAERRAFSLEEEVEAPPTPTQGGPEDGRTLADSVLQAIQTGSIVTRGGPQTYRKYRGPPSKQKNSSEMSVQERVKQHMETVAEAEKKLATLQTEKEKLEAALQRVPRTGARVTFQAKQSQLKMEQRLEEVTKEIHSVRMVLRNHHALKK